MRVLDRLTKRHIAKVLSRLDDIQSPQVVKDEVKRSMYFFARDIDEQLLCPDCRGKESEFNEPGSHKRKF